MIACSRVGVPHGGRRPRAVGTLLYLITPEENLSALSVAWGGFRGWQMDRSKRIISKMTIHALKLLTPEEFASLIEVALAERSPELPHAHLSKLVALGYVVETTKGRLGMD